MCIRDRDGAELQAAKMRLLELPAEREALHELMSDAAITPEEKTRYGELYGAAAKAGKAVDLVTRKRKAEIDRIFPIFKDQYDAGTWSGGAFALDELSRIETVSYTHLKFKNIVRTIPFSCRRHSRREEDGI